jgi:hypothetical protein
MVGDRRGCEWAVLGGLADCARLAVGEHTDRDCALGDRVRKLAPRIDELVVVEVKRAEQRTDDRPVELLAHER